MNLTLLSASSELDFGIRVIKNIRLGNIELAFTDSLWYAMWICVFLCVLAIIINIKLRKVDPLQPPKGFLHLVEIGVDFVYKMVKDTMGMDSIGFASFYGGMILYILLCNLSGMFLWFAPTQTGISIGFMRPPTADLAVNAGLALMTFFMTQGFAIKAKGVLGWLKALTEPVAVLTPINLIGEVANPVSLSFRLLGNVLAGTIIMGIYYALLPTLFYLFSPALHFYFDLFAGVLQSYIFVMLSMIYVSGAME